MHKLKKIIDKIYIYKKIQVILIRTALKGVYKKYTGYPMLQFASSRDWLNAIPEDVAYKMAKYYCFLRDFDNAPRNELIESLINKHRFCIGCQAYSGECYEHTGRRVR